MKKNGLYFLLMTCWHIMGYNAFICVPVTDYVGSAYDQKPIPFFSSLGFSASGAHQFELCPRIGQGLFQEQVTVVEKAPGQVRIEIPQQFFITKTNRKKQHSYWMLEDHIVYLDQLKPEDRKKLPTPLSFKQPQQTHTNIVTLKHPFYSKELDAYLSAGTRFVISSALPRARHLRVYAYSASQKKCIEIALPKESCIFYTNKETNDEKVKQMISIIRNWCSTSDSHIPYVLGGSSYIDRITTDDVTKQTVPNTNGSHSTIFKPVYSQWPLTGLDCAALICRTAQIAQLPFYYKNSITMALLLKPLSPKDQLHEGDVIWVPGHVMMIADVKNNSIFEARSYDHGYGKVQEIPIAKVFDGILTLSDLVKHFHAHKTLYRKDITGTVRDTYHDWKILTLSSAWSGC